jgi:hypothetical protein
VRLHLLGCALCARYEKQLLAMRKMLEAHSQEINEALPEARLSAEARDRIKKKIKEDHL